MSQCQSTLSSVYSRAPRVLWQRVLALASYPSILTAVETGVEALASTDCWIVLSFRGQQFELNQLGAFVWEVLAEPRSIAELSAIVSKTFDADPDYVSAELQEFLSRLTELRLLAHPHA